MARRVSYESSGFSIGSIVPYAIFGGIGYYLYHNWDSISSMLPNFASGGGSSSPSTVEEVAKIIPPITTLPNIPLSVTNPTGNPNITVGSQIAPPSNAGSADSTYAKMSRWIGQNVGWFNSHAGLATFDEWNSIRGNFESAPETIEDIFPGVDRAATMTLQEYFNGLTSKGVAGLSGLFGMSIAGLGKIVDIDAFLEPTRMLRRGNHR